MGGRTMNKINAVAELESLLEQHADRLDILLLGFEVDQRRGVFHAMFADMCCKTIPLSAIPAPRPLDWRAAQLEGPFLLRVSLKDGKGTYEIPTNELRALVDAKLVKAEGRHATKHRAHIGRRLREKRLESGLTQAGLAKAAGVKRVTVNRIENGNQEAKIGTLEKLGQVLRLDWVMIFDEEAEVAND